MISDPSPLQLISMFLQEAENQIAANGAEQSTTQAPPVIPTSPVGSPTSTGPPQSMDIDLRAMEELAEPRNDSKCKLCCRFLYLCGEKILIIAIFWLFCFNSGGRPQAGILVVHLKMVKGCLNILFEEKSIYVKASENVSVIGLTVIHKKLISGKTSHQILFHQSEFLWLTVFM